MPRFNVRCLMFNLNFTQIIVKKSGTLQYIIFGNFAKNYRDEKKQKKYESENYKNYKKQGLFELLDLFSSFNFFLPMFFVFSVFGLNNMSIPQSSSH